MPSQVLGALLVEKTDNKQTNTIMSAGRRWQRNKTKEKSKTKKEKVSGGGDRPV